MKLSFWFKLNRTASSIGATGGCTSLIGAEVVVAVEVGVANAFDDDLDDLLLLDADFDVDKLEVDEEVIMVVDVVKDEELAADFLGGLTSCKRIWRDAKLISKLLLQSSLK